MTLAFLKQGEILRFTFTVTQNFINVLSLETTKESKIRDRV